MHITAMNCSCQTSRDELNRLKFDSTDQHLYNIYCFVTKCMKSLRSLNLGHSIPRRADSELLQDLASSSLQFFKAHHTHKRYLL